MNNPLNKGQKGSMRKKDAVAQAVAYMRLFAEIFENEPDINEVTIHRNGLVPIELDDDYYEAAVHHVDPEITNEEWLKDFAKATQ